MEPRSAAEESGYKVWTIAYKVVLPKKFLKETEWSKSAGRLAAMNQRLLRTERNEYGELWKKVLATHEKSLELERSSAAICEARNSGTDRRHFVKRAQRLGQEG